MAAALFAVVIVLGGCASESETTANETPYATRGDEEGQTAGERHNGPLPGRAGEDWGGW